MAITKAEEIATQALQLGKDNRAFLQRVSDKFTFAIEKINVKFDSIMELKGEFKQVVKVVDKVSSKVDDIGNRVVALESRDKVENSTTEAKSSMDYKFIFKIVYIALMIILVLVIALTKIDISNLGG